MSLGFERLQRTCAPLKQLKVQSANVATTLSHRERQHLTALSTLSEAALPELIIEASLITVFDPETLRREAVVKVEKEGVEGTGTVNDPRMGVTDNGKVCGTCFKDNLDCPGHLGYISLNTYIIHPLFLDMVVKVLKSVCNSCGELLLSPEDIKDKGFARFSGSERLKLIAEASEKLPCRATHHGNVHVCQPNPEYLAGRTKELKKVMYKLKAVGQKKGKEIERTPEEIYHIFGTISQADAEALGFLNGSHPQRLILTAFPVIPPNARPDRIRDGYRGKDYLTELYINIVKSNNRLAKSLSESERADAITKLTEAIRLFIDNSDSRATQGNRRDLTTIKQRIQGKKALIRGALMGKRVNYTGRTVLGPEPSLKYGQIRVPEKMAPYLTVLERVASYNMGKLTGLLRAGRVSYIIPGEGNFKGKRIRIDPKSSKEYTLRFGDQVERWLTNGDYVIFNRQPTLHKQSMTGYEVVLGKPMTIGLHLSDTTPKNADFDGDEGNVHSLQTIGAMSEARELMNVKNCLMNAQTNKPAVGVVYDGITGAYLMTQLIDGKGVTVDKAVYNDLMLLLTNQESLPSLDQRLKEMGVEKYSGRGLFSTLLPPDFYYSKGAVTIIMGVLVHGTITKDHIGPASGSIVQALYKEYGANRVMDFLTDAPFLINGWLEHHGFSVGLKDCYVGAEASPEQLRQAIRDILTDSGQLEVERLEQELEEIDRFTYPQRYADLQRQLVVARNRVDRDLLSQIPALVENRTEVGNATIRRLLDEEIAKAKLNVEALGTKLDDPLEEERRESQIVGYVNVTSEVGRRISTEQLAPSNALNVMALSGAKGSVSNIAQITGMLGQQFILGQRMPVTISEGQRCLPYFEEGNLDPESRGFCKSSFLSGMTPAELFFHQAGGREGLMDTAIKTSETGSIHHQLIKALEDIKIAYDGSVRNATGTIFQFAYGEDGFDAGDLEPVKIDSVDTTFFTNVERVVGRINASFGYYSEVQQGEQVVAYQRGADEIDNDRFDMGDYEEFEMD